MNEADRSALEHDVRTHCERGDFDGAATIALRGYGAEVLGFLAAMHRDETAASEAFSAFAESLWRGLPRFGWNSSLRTWAYAVARNVSLTARRKDRRQNGGRLGESALADLAQEIRTSTLGFLRTEKRTRLEAIRDTLSTDDRSLLILRLDRGLSWKELARVLAVSDAPMDDDALTRESARLRKRFQVLKDELREQARREGLRDT